MPLDTMRVSQILCATLMLMSSLCWGAKPLPKVDPSFFEPVTAEPCQTWVDTLLPYSSWGHVRSDLFFAKKINLTGCVPENQGFVSVALTSPIEIPGEVSHPVTTPTRELFARAPVSQDTVPPSPPAVPDLEPATYFSELTVNTFDQNLALLLPLMGGVLVVLALNRQKITN